MKTKSLAIPGAFLILVSAALAKAEDQSWKKTEISLCLGYGFPKAADSSFYRLEWNPGGYPIRSAETFISMDSKKAIYLGALFSLFFSRNFGVQTGFGYLKSGQPNETAFHLSSADGSALRNDSWQGKGEVTAVPLCLNLAGRMSLQRFQAGVSGGISVFLNSFYSNANAGTAVASPLPSQVFDIFQIKIVVEDTTWSALGGNFGGSVEFRISGGLALTAEARAFICPKKKFVWTWKSGEYEGLIGNIPRWNLDQESAKNAESRAKPLSVNPSYIAVGIGFKFLR